MYAIEAINLTKKYKNQRGAENISLTIEQGEIYGLLGPNGCGKSTLIRIIDGMVEPDSGTVEIGETIRIGYFAQEVPDMDGNQRVIDYILSLIHI